ncbi:hypothetical protein [Wukongibacter sp. M2B1]|uniref:hypothetical protein n=1 Tax=Wukongibacter sp. M2B1 TaxID=3088895 RepID=UPI003D78D271
MVRNNIEICGNYIKIPGILPFSTNHFNKKIRIYERINIHFFRKISNIREMGLNIYNSSIIIDKKGNKIIAEIPIRCRVDFTDIDGINRLTAREGRIKRIIKFKFENINEKNESYNNNISLKIARGEIDKFSLTDSSETSVATIAIRLDGQLTIT